MGVELSSEGLAVFFETVQPKEDDRLIAFGWAMAEELASGKIAH